MIPKYNNKILVEYIILRSVAYFMKFVYFLEDKKCFYRTTNKIIEGHKK